MIPKPPSYESLAAELRERALQARSPESRQELNRLAEQYRRLAERALREPLPPADR